jgi:acetyltransferase-like isoleucine patch superfamily enzyme
MSWHRYKPLLYKADHWILMPLVRWLYPQYVRPRQGYQPLCYLLWRYAFWQKVLRYNGTAEWPVHFTSRIHHPGRIQKGVCCDPGDSPGVYINAVNGLVLGDNVRLAPGVVIVTANHVETDYRRSTRHSPVRIGNHVWIGANAVVLPGVTIGENVIIGAGAVVTNNIPPNSVAVGNPCRVIREKKLYQEDSPNAF